jgi:hypothetical protein
MAAIDKQKTKLLGIKKRTGLSDSQKKELKTLEDQMTKAFRQYELLEQKKQDKIPIT